MTLDYKVLQSTVKYHRVLQSTTKYYREYYRNAIAERKDHDRSNSNCTYLCEDVRSSGHMHIDHACLGQLVSLHMIMLFIYTWICMYVHICMYRHNRDVQKMEHVSQQQ